MDDLTIYDAMPDQGQSLALYDFEPVIDRFLAALDRKPRTLEAYRKGLRYFFAWLRDQGTAQPTRAHVKAYKAHLMEEYKVSTVAAYLAAVRAFFRWIAQETGNPALNIADGIHAPKQTKEHKKDALKLDQARHVLAVMPSDTLAEKRNAAIVSLMVHAALRDVEITRLNLRDLYTMEGSQFINVWGKGRDSADKSVKVGSAAYQAIQDYLQAREQIDGPLKDTAPLFASVSRRNYGQRLDTRTVSGIGKAALKAAGYDSPRLTAHSLRHTAITVLLESGGTLHDAQMLARHESPATTEIYDHSDQDRANRAADMLAEALAG